MKILMCPPSYFSIDYEINPWMHKSDKVDINNAQEQWETLKRTYESLGVEVKVISPVSKLPDMVFTANAGLVQGKKAVVSNFKYPQRQPESKYFKHWFEKNDFEAVELENDEYFEGQGEALWFKDTLVSGWGFRATIESHLKLSNILHGNILSVKLVNSSYYHLDTCFLPLNETTAAYFPDAFDFSSKKDLETLIPNLIEVSDSDARAFACNSVVVGKKVLMPSGAKELPRDLEKLGFEVILLDVKEFKKSGGGVRCLTLTLEN